MQIVIKMASGAQGSKVELQSELDNSRIVARGDDAAEIAGIEHLSRCGVDTATGGKESVQVADGIGEIRMIQEVEEFSAKFEIARFGQRKELSKGKIQIHLSRSAQTVSTNVPDVRPCGRSRRGSTRAGDSLTNGD